MIHSIYTTNSLICPHSPSFSMIPSGAPNMCYGVEVTKLFSHYKSSLFCIYLFGGTLPEPQNKGELKAIADWVVSKGIPLNSTAGFWTRWQRTVEAPAGPDGTVSAANQAIRENRALFQTPEGVVAPKELWRNRNQPGNDVIQDEICTAQKKPGQSSEFLGIDDYACDGYQNHYMVCQIPAIPESQ